MTRILVTGGAGFVGRHAVAKLRSEGHGVIVPSRSDFDLADPMQAVKMIRRYKPDVLLHLAWYTQHGQFWMADNNYAWLSSGKKMIDAFYEAGGQRAVIAGTCAEYDWASLTLPITEQSPLKPHTVYGQCKLELFQHCQKHAQLGANFLWGRLFLLYGPGEYAERFIPSIILSLLKGETAKMSPGSQVRDFMHAQDAGEALALACLRPDVTGPLNIAQGEADTLLNIAKKLQMFVGQGIIDPTAYPLRPDEPDSLAVDVIKLRQDLQFFTSNTLDEGLKTIVQYWKRNKTV